jgi:hypothetical protein
MDTFHVDGDVGDTHNVFQLTPAQLKQRSVIHVDAGLHEDPAGPSPRYALSPPPPPIL